MRPYGNLVNFGLLRTIEMDLKIQNMFSFAALTHEIIDNVLAIISRLFSRKWAIFNQGLVETLNQIPYSKNTSGLSIVLLKYNPRIPVT